MTTPVPRVDERVLGAGTRARFVMLMVLITATTGLMTLQVAILLSDRRGGTDCALAAGVDPDESTSLAMGIALLAQSGPYQACMSRDAAPPAWWLPVAWPLVVLAAGMALFAVLPALKTRRGRAVPLAEVDDGRLAARLAGLVTEAGLSRQPRFVVDPGAVSSAGAVVFGRNRRATVCLHSGLVARRDKDPERFRAVLLHEFAHIRNGDVTLTYFTVAVWRVFLALTVVPYLVVTTISTVSWSGATFGISQVVNGARGLLLVGVLVVLVTLARADVLRSREIHADLAAVRCGAEARVWAAEAVPRTAFGRLRAFVTGPWNTHPRWQVRHDSLGEPVALFRVQPLALVLGGAAAMLVNYNATISLYQYGISPYGPVAEWAHQAVALATAALVAAVAGIAIWRAVAYAVLTGGPGPSSARMGWWLGAGMAAAEVVTHRFSTTRWLPAYPEVLVLVVLGGVVIAWWVKQTAVLGVRAWRGGSLRPVVLIGLVAAALVMAWWFAWWVAGGGAVFADGWPFTGDGVRQQLSHELAGATAARPADVSPATVVAAMAATLMANVLQAPLVPLGVVALSVVPLLAWLIRPGDTAPRWSLGALSGSGSSAFTAAEPMPPIGRVLVPGVVAGLASWAVAAGVRAATGAGTAAVAHQAGDQAMRYLAWLAVVLLAAAATAAVVVSALTSGYRMLTALVAAHTAVLIGSAGIVVLLAADDCVKPSNSPWMVCHGPPVSLWQVLSWSLQAFVAPVLVLAAVVAVVVAVCFRVFDGLVPRRRQAPVPAPGRLGWRRAAAGVLCAAALGAAGVQVDHVARAQAVPRDLAAVQQTAQRVLATTDVPMSPRTAALQSKAWRREGGDWLVRHVRASGKQYDLVLRDLATKGQGTWPNIRGKLGPVCEEFGRLSDAAAGYFRVPDRAAQTTWYAMTTLLARASRNCRDALARQDIGPIRGVHADFRGALLGCERTRNRLGAVERAGSG